MKHKGFTLIELMMTIAIGAIVLTLGIPSFMGTIRSNRITTQANELVTSLNYARSEAIKRGVQVTVRRLSPTNQVWESGWEVFTDFNENGARDDGGNPCAPGAVGNTDDCLLRTFPALPQGYTLRTGLTIAQWIAYRADGTSVGSGGLPNDTFRLCDDTASAAAGRSIIVNRVGRTRVEEGAGACP